jgi:hypothetical protein
MAITNVPLEIVQARGPSGAAGSVSPAQLAAAIAALKGGVSPAHDTLKEIEDHLALLAPLASPALTGIPTAPTAANGTDSIQISTTAFVQQELTNALLDVLRRTGGTMLGALILAADPLVALGAATKQYADARETAAKAYADNLVVGLLDDRGNYDASGNLFPASGGSGAAGAIKKGDIWTVSVGGTLGGNAVAIGDQVRALTDAPGQTAANWAISEANIGYVPENAANKDTDGTLAANSDTKFASQKATRTYADTKLAKASNLSDLVSAATARTNLGLGALATKATIATADVDNDAVTYAKMQNVSATSRFLGRKTAGAGDPEELTAADAKTILAIAAGDVSGLATIATSGNATDLSAGTVPAARMPAHTGDVTSSAGAVALTVANDAITYAKMQNVTATDRLLGRSTAGAGDVEEIVCTAAGRALVDDADAAAQRVTLGMGVGQISGTATNDNAAAGKVGEYVESSGQGSGTATITIASPAVITFAGHTFNGVAAIVFSTTGALPTGMTAGTTYYTLAGTVAGSPFSIATSAANALAGTAINTTGSQSGTQTANASIALATGVTIDMAAISLSAGDWDIWLTADLSPASTTVNANTDISIGEASATRPPAPNSRLTRLPPFTGNGQPLTVIAGPYRASIAGVTSYFGVVRANFSVSTFNYLGVSMRARRVR